MTVATDTDIAQPWIDRAPELAEWTFGRLVNRDDAWGQYLPLSQRTSKQKALTQPPKSARGRIPLYRANLEMHFRAGDGNEGDIIGLHSTSQENMSRWLGIDIDAHEGDEADPQANLAAAFAWYEKLSGLGFNPLLSDSNGKGGYHLLVIFAEPVPTWRAHAFGKWLVADHAMHGLEKSPETFPKQAELKPGGFGNWLRLPGRHHTRDHWSRFYDPDQGWLEDADAVDAILTTKGDDPTFIPTEIPTAKPQRKARQRRQPLPADRRKALSALESLKRERSDDYGQWVQVGQILKTIDDSDSMCEAWRAWSERSGKYINGQCAAKWNSFDPQGELGIGTLIQWAMEDGWKADFSITNIETIEVPKEPIKALSTEEPIEDDAGDNEPKTKTVVVPKPMSSILRDIKRATDDWPRRVGGALFVHGRDVAWLESTAATFGYLSHETGPIRWHKLTGAASKNETYEELRRTATAYDAVEHVPHEPLIDRHYYACSIPSPGSGAMLRHLVDRFAPETDIDADLILSMFVTGLWGGAGGTRPAFVITAPAGRGVGKSKLVSMFGHLFGGAIELSAGEDASIIKQRLLSPEGVSSRVLLIDNVKARSFSWSELEALITAPRISGKRLYVGEGSRPNTITWCITLNGVGLSTDLAQRSVIIKLRKPDRAPSWEEETRAFIDASREAIFADVIGYLRSERYQLDRYSRWASWERDVLSRLPEPGEAQKVIAERQGVADVEAEEGDIIETYFRQRLANLNYNPRTDAIRIPVRIAAEWLNLATGERHKVTSASRQLRQMIDEGRLENLQADQCRSHGRCFQWMGEDSTASTVAMSDLEDRVNKGGGL